jgi:hypothetical protein
VTVDLEPADQLTPPLPGFSEKLDIREDARKRGWQLMGGGLPATSLQVRLPLPLWEEVPGGHYFDIKCGGKGWG